MRITWRQLANFVVVAVVGVVATGWAAIQLADVRLWGPSPSTVEVHLAASGGALKGAEVSYLGVSIGKVKSVELTADDVTLQLEVEPTGDMASELRADVRQKTSLGEPYVDLAPAGPDAEKGEIDGAVIPIERTSTPQTLNKLFKAGADLLDTVDAEDLGKVADGMSGLVGHDEDLRAILAAGAELGEIASNRQAELGRVFSSMAQLVATLEAHQGELQQAVAGGADLGAVLAGREAELRAILEKGAQVGADGSELLARAQDGLDGTLSGLDATLHTLASRPTKTHEILEYTPRFVTELGRTFDDNATYSSMQGMPNMPVSPVYGLPLVGTGLRIDKIFLPSIAQRIILDGGAFPAIKLISPEEAYAASQSAEAYRAAQAKAEEELMTQGPQATP